MFAVWLSLYSLFKHGLPGFGKIVLSKLIQFFIWCPNLFCLMHSVWLHMTRVRQLRATSKHHLWPVPPLGALVCSWTVPSGCFLSAVLHSHGFPGQPFTGNSAGWDCTVYSQCLRCKWCPWGCALLQPCSTHSHCWGSEQRIPYRADTRQGMEPKTTGEDEPHSSQGCLCPWALWDPGSSLSQEKVLRWKTWVQVLNLPLTCHVTLGKSSPPFSKPGVGMWSFLAMWSLLQLFSSSAAVQKKP